MSESTFTWNVQPYALVSELVENYTRAVISVTRMTVDSRANEAEEWMKQNAPWKDRSEEERRIRRVKFRREKERRKAVGLHMSGRDVPDRHAREALSVRVVEDPNLTRFWEAEPGVRKRFDERRLQEINRERALKNVGRPESRRLKMLTALPKSQQTAYNVAQKIRSYRGPIAELRFQHGRDIWYGVWLEIAHGGRWGIISRAVEHWSPILMRDIKRNANLKQFSITFSEEVETEEGRFAKFIESENTRFQEMGDVERRYQPWTPERQRQRRVDRARHRRESESKLRSLEELVAKEEAKRQAAIKKATAHLERGETPGGIYNPGRRGR